MIVREHNYYIGERWLQEFPTLYRMLNEINAVLNHHFTTHAPEDSIVIVWIPKKVLLDIMAMQAVPLHPHGFSWLAYLQHNNFLTAMTGDNLTIQPYEFGWWR